MTCATSHEPKLQATSYRLQATGRFFVIPAKRTFGSRELESRPEQFPSLVEVLENNGDKQATMTAKQHPNADSWIDPGTQLSLG